MEKLLLAAVFLAVSGTAMAAESTVKLNRLRARRRCRQTASLVTASITSS